ncbi:MAG TPA: hypothetical protein VFU00_06245 [Gemmatimonadales bacterium]|nr:hypothetical protein [Gemmatimonadales bacterium]
MISKHVHDRLVASSTTGRYGAFVGVGAGLAILGLILLLRSLSGADAVRAWQLFHVNWVYFTGLMFGGVAFAAAQKITNAKWSGLVVRFAEACIAFFPISLIGLVLIFTVGYEPIFGRMHEELHGMQHSKAVWLSHGFMFGRLLVGVILLGWVGWRLVRADLLPDVYAARGTVGGGRRALFEKWSRSYDESEYTVAHHNVRIHRLAPIYALLYAIVMSVIAFDMIMALQPHWFSNLLGGFYFMGSFLGALMLLALLAMYGAGQLGIADLVSPKQRHDLGKLCFGFTVFWAYLMWAQFLVIWYGNMPEETGFVYARLWGHWLPIGRLVVIGLFVVPFFGLLGVLPKKTRGTLALFAIVSLTALWLERYLLVLPSISPLPGPAFGVAELAPTFLMAGLFLLSYALFARTFPMVSPRLAEITINRELGHHAVEIFDHEDADADYLHEPELER